MQKLKFTKMQGLGNDYIYFNCFNQTIYEPIDLAIFASDRHFGVGGDGIILILPSEVADAKMRIFNADGSEGMMCGNGIRCVAKYLFDNKMVSTKHLTIETLSGIKKLEVEAVNDIVVRVKVDMGAPILEGKLIPVTIDKPQIVNEPIDIDGVEFKITCVSMGNPHCVIFVDDVATLPLAKIGMRFECAPYFPERVNTEFVEVVDDHTIKMRVWERGSGETLACGTGACASAVAGVLNGILKRNEEITVKLRGGDLAIIVAEDTVYMTGTAEKVFEGEIEL